MPLSFVRASVLSISYPLHISKSIRSTTLKIHKWIDHKNRYSALHISGVIALSHFLVSDPYLIEYNRY